MVLSTFLIQQKEIMDKVVDCFEREKSALMKEDAKGLLDIIEEKKLLIDSLENLEEKRQEVFPNTNLTKLEESGLLNEELKVIAKELRFLAEKINQLQETNHLLTEQSLEYIQQMLHIIHGSDNPVNPSYGADGKMGDNSSKKKSVLDQSI